MDLNIKREEFRRMGKTCSNIVLAVLLTCMIMLMLSIQIVDVAAEKVSKLKNENHVQIVERRITTSELGKLKTKIGVRKEGKNYNEIINGHGTGLSPPAEEEWTEILNKAYVVERILSNDPIPSSVDHAADPWFPPI